MNAVFRCFLCERCLKATVEDSERTGTSALRKNEDGSEIAVLKAHAELRIALLVHNAHFVRSRARGCALSAKPTTNALKENRSIRIMRNVPASNQRRLSRVAALRDGE
jgi:hypothetical protein